MMNRTRLPFMLTGCILLGATWHSWALAEDRVRELIDKAMAASESGQNDEALKLISTAIEKDPTVAVAYYVRGRARFRAGKILDSVADFDKYIELQPTIAPRQWERGIACFYAGRYQQGAKQFESYQTFDGHDVENSVWRFLCMVPEVGVKRAQVLLLPIDHDRRVPMMQVYDLYRGKLKPEDVIAAAEAGNPNREVLAGRMFYVNLYLGLWYDANGNKQEARRYIKLAADEKLKDNRQVNRYMWDVARIHDLLLRGELERPAAEKK